ncbi:hypothetical protein COS31_04795 [Candidatus Roizmanbacteria bacterium CG02_land_8_20_14_3_00_36_15]|uniref:Uncharacterized protein n=1 Tax=Candidatus Roizmanbacteria bacterium CG10_big_fil_rev_8_21_14_0_10_36_26 TaxID=1974851 RepID=A0A2M8KKA2_9BACT|nr:MAG: hypothetical protein COS51_01905 [Candidatus Roizmanbacteria bacterium CG03_land_8_20_14_0_80_36_21]PIV37483.1 MAG: hypothetical protein COS31_04795 [Candidatus Roizmanbacteria bacterium CG02_land_8_20_14_3_00_36_15]PIY70559.1 MAG: hypothetical protein COY89_00850 [Candidatus Roizmanbacteria bacterium CG_4_10_14_0_8_um_filter_36_36]PJA52467.1 MAG: hypothetical protein CO166_05700 [Candidatus Roizmanbacteria bacterium CG_4_9_14_3_um_filter_36_11]PJE60356.1 MAG: hypothetical protein COU86
MNDTEPDSLKFPPIKKSASDDFFITIPPPYTGRSAFTTCTSLGLEMSRVVASALILKPGEELCLPDYFAFIVLPLPPHAKPGTEREYIPVVTRTTVDSLGPQLAAQVTQATEEQISAWEEKGIP